MRVLRSLLRLSAALFLLATAATPSLAADADPLHNEYDEHLLLKTLPGNSVYEISPPSSIPPSPPASEPADEPPATDWPRSAS